MSSHGKIIDLSSKKIVQHIAYLQKNLKNQKFPQNGQNGLVCDIFRKLTFQESNPNI